MPIIKHELSHSIDPTNNSIDFHIAYICILHFRLAKDTFSRSKNLIILGNLKTSRLPIFSFLIRHKDTGLFLHHNFVSSLLNDLFGIQSRGGCACAGPYAQVLINIYDNVMHVSLTKNFNKTVIVPC